MTSGKPALEEPLLRLITLPFLSREVKVSFKAAARGQRIVQDICVHSFTTRAKCRLVQALDPVRGQPLSLSKAAFYRQGSSGTRLMHGKCGPRRGELLPLPLHQDIPGPPDTASRDSEGMVPLHSEG